MHMPCVAPSHVDALAVVVDHELSTELKVLREKNARLEGALSCLQKVASDNRKYYFKLVWIARGWAEDDRVNDPQIRADIRDMDREEQFAKDVENLSGDEGDWNHGFNSGMLAASRMFEGLANATEDIPCIYGSTFTAEQQRTLSINEFPMLDT